MLNAAYDFIDQAEPLRRIESRLKTIDSLVKETVESAYFLREYLRDPDFSARLPSFSPVFASIALTRRGYR